MTFKKHTVTLPEQTYRDLDAFNYSVLSALDEVGPQALLEKESKKSVAFDFGTYVDILLTDPDNKDKVFYTEAIEKPTASLLTLADAIIKDAIILDWTLDDITIERIQRKVEELKLWDNLVDPDKKRAKWDNDLFNNYIKASILSKGKIILTPDILEAAEHCANVLKTHEFTKYYFEETENVEVLKQACILYMFKGFQGKARIDLIRVDHIKKIIYPFDIKTGSELPMDFEVSFYRYRYYLQVISYLLAIQYLVETVDELKGYKIDTFKFIYISKKLPDVPVIWEVPEALLNKFVDGWVSYSGRRVKGFMELLDDYIFYKTNNIYNTERKVIANNGIQKVELL